MITLFMFVGSFIIFEEGNGYLMVNLRHPTEFTLSCLKKLHLKIFLEGMNKIILLD